MAIVKLIDTPADPVRLAFVHVFKKREGMQRDDGTKGEDKYELTAILQPGGDNEKRLQAAIMDVAKEKYGDKLVKDDDGNEMPNWQYVLKTLDEDRKGLRNGNKKRDKGNNIVAGFEGMKYITARNTTRPTVVDRTRAPLTAEDGKPYSGCYGTVHIDVWALKKQGVKPCIVADLTGVQFTRDGDAFGGGPAPSSADDFDDLGAGEEAFSGESAPNGMFD